jgi:HPt (histidine-containing phosphotransfer) domain-containing protein
VPQTHHPDEIQDRLRKRFLDRLSDRLKRIRRDLIAREWQGLRHECRQLRAGGETFGFRDLSALAGAAESAIPAGETSRARILPEAKQAVEQLVVRIEVLLQSQAS